MKSYKLNIIIIILISLSHLSCNDSEICNISVHTTNGGSATISNYEIINGGLVTLTAKPEQGYIFKGWSINGMTISSKNPYTTEINSDVQFTANFESIYAPTGYNNGYGYIDLGLSVKWATCNIGASNPEERGKLYAWGETKPKSYYDWQTYKWCNGNSYTINKYWYSDNKLYLDIEDDAANFAWGSNWRMPTKKEIEELLVHCIITSDVMNGATGFTITNPKTNKSIFLPAIGSISNTKTACYYWSSSLNENNFCHAYMMYVYYSSGINIKDISRASGFNIRPVCE